MAGTDLNGGSSVGIMFMTTFIRSCLPQIFADQIVKYSRVNSSTAAPD